MLGKLIKNEFIQTSKSLITVYAAAGVTILFMLLSYVTDITWIGATGSSVLVLIGFISLIMTLVMIVNNFAHSLYGNQGYLSYTLPVKCSNLLFSKFIVSFAWVIIAYAVLFLTIIIVVWYFKAKSNGIIESAFEMIRGLQVINDLPTMNSIITYVVIMGVGSIITVLSMLSFVFFAITVANTRSFQHKPTLFGLVFFFIAYFVNKIASTGATYNLPLSIVATAEGVSLQAVSMSDAQNVLFVYGIGGKIFTAVFAVVLLLITGWIMEKKVNVK